MICYTFVNINAMVKKYICVCIIITVSYLSVEDINEL